MPQFRDILAKMIADHPVSLTGLARQAGMDPALLSRAARGLKLFPAKHARSLGVALGLSGADLAAFVVEAHLDASTAEIRSYVDALRRQVAAAGAGTSSKRAGKRR
jgi:hypothetical protein